MFNNNPSQETIDRLSLLLVLDTYQHPFQKKELIEFIINNEIIKYFEMHQLLQSMIDNKLIDIKTIENELYYVITENGRISLTFFKDRIPYDLQSTIIDLISLIKKPSYIKHTISTYYEKLDIDNYEVFLELFENQKRIMKLSLTVISKKQALQLIDSWEKKSEFLYGDIIHLLTKEIL